MYQTRGGKEEEKSEYIISGTTPKLPLTTSWKLLYQSGKCRYGNYYIIQVNAAIIVLVLFLSRTSQLTRPSAEHRIGIVIICKSTLL